jgi:hypothetical protein
VIRKEKEREEKPAKPIIQTKKKGGADISLPQKTQSSL